LLPKTPKPLLQIIKIIYCKDIIHSILTFYYISLTSRVTSPAFTSMNSSFCSSDFYYSSATSVVDPSLSEKGFWNSSTAGIY